MNENLSRIHTHRRASGDLSYLGWGLRQGHRWQSQCKAAAKKETTETIVVDKYLLGAYLECESESKQIFALLNSCKVSSNVRAMNTTLCCMQSIWEHRDVCLTVATRNWILPNSCIPLPNLIFRYCDRWTAEVITRQTISAYIPHPSSPLIFILFNDPQVHFNIVS